MPVERIEFGENLRQGTVKLNESIDQSNEAITEATTAKAQAAQAHTTAQSVQQQFNQVVIEGDSSVEAAQARVDETGQTFTTLKAHLDNKGERISTLGAQTQANFNKTFDRVNFLGVKEYSHLKVAIASGYDWAPAINQALLDAKVTKKKLVLHADEDMYITTSIKPDVSSKIVGFGKYNSPIRMVGGITGIDLTGPAAKTGVEISSISIFGDMTPGQVAIDAYYVVNGSNIRDIRIENVDTALRMTKCWYAAFENFRISQCLNYGVHAISLSAMEQINGIVFKNFYIQGAKHNVFLDGINVSAAVKFDSCTFEHSKETAVVSNGFAPLTFDNCYFESNFTNAQTSVTLTYDKPIDVKVTSTPTRTPVKFTGCYFARLNNFLSSNEKTSIYIGSNVKPIFEACQFVCNSSAYIDANVYSASVYPAVFTACQEDGYAKKNYIGAQRDEMVAMQKAYNLRYTSTMDANTFGITQESGDYAIKFIPHSTIGNAGSSSIRVENVSDNTLIGSAALPASFTKDTVVEVSVGYIAKGRAVQLKGGSSTGVDVIGTVYLVRKHNDY